MVRKRGVGFGRVQSYTLLGFSLWPERWIDPPCYNMRGCYTVRSVGALP